MTPCRLGSAGNSGAPAKGAGERDVTCLRLLRAGPDHPARQGGPALRLEHLHGAHGDRRGQCLQPIRAAVGPRHLDDGAQG